MRFLTLSQLQQQIRQTLEGNVRDCWVVAEISELNVNNSGHCYLTFVEKGGANHIPRARIGGVIWRSAFPMIDAYFREATGIPLSAGIQVLVQVSVIYHELYGISLQVKNIDPTYTLGDMQRQRQECIRRLKEDGVYDMNRELDYPVVIERIAVISSDKAAGYQDFINELERNEYGYRFDTTLFRAFMQGAEAESSIIAALNRIAEKPEDFDAVVLIRGGGAQSDLGCFDSYLLCSNLAQFPLPVLTGIGHNKDTSVADLVARESVKTPTAAARFLIDRMLEFETRLGKSLDYIREAGKGLLGDSRERLERLAQSLRFETQERIHGGQRALDRCRSEIRAATDTTLKMASRTAEEYRNRLERESRQQLAGQRQRLALLRKTLFEHARRLTAGEKNRLDLLAGTLNGYDPARILRQGYSITVANGKIIRGTADVSVGDRIEIRISDGTLSGTVTHKSKNIVP